MTILLWGCLGLAVPVAAGEIDPTMRTADLSDSWLVLYNSHPVFGIESTQWALWYQSQREIPDDHLLALNIDTNAEHLSDYTAASAAIFQPLRDYLTSRPDVADRVMGIVQGFKLPGSFGQPILTPQIGGWSIASSLQDPFNVTSDGLFGFGDNFAYAALADLSLNIPSNRLTRADLLAAPDGRPRYLVARIDAPTLGMAQNLTLHAHAIASNGLAATDIAYWDDFDPGFPSGPFWAALGLTVDQACISGTRWAAFDLDANGGHQDAAFRFDVYRLVGWASFLSPNGGGSRVLAYDLNSFGAITARSTGDSGFYFSAGSPISEVFLPNAISAGYASAIGATGEPTSVLAPHPGVMMAALQRGWTLGEAFFLANGSENGFWQIVGDPLLQVGQWWSFDDCNDNAIDDACEDCNSNGTADECDLSAGTSRDCDANATPDECQSADCNSNGTFDACEIVDGLVNDCNDNLVPDDCELVNGSVADCNSNELPDSCDLAAGTSLDCNTNALPDECETSSAIVKFLADDFPQTGDPDANLWQDSTTADVSTARRLSDPASLRFFVHRMAVTHPIDLAESGNASLVFWALPMETCPGVDFVVDYSIGTGWQLLADISGGATQDVWQRYELPIPGSALQADFLLRFRNVLGTSCPGGKTWYLDDVRLEGTSRDENLNLVPDVCETNYELMFICISGPCPQVPCQPLAYPLAFCADFDVDADGDLDLVDLAAFQIDPGE